MSNLKIINISQKIKLLIKLKFFKYQNNNKRPYENTIFEEKKNLS